MSVSSVLNEEHVSASACPACVAAPAAEALAQAAPRDARIMLSLPSAHCATCISDVERRLAPASAFIRPA